MSDFKPLLLVLLCIFVIGAMLNLTVGKHVDLNSPDSESALYGFADFVENGWDISITVPIFGSISTNVNPVSWLWLGIDSVTDFVSNQLNLLTYLPNSVALPLLVLSILAFAFTIVTLIRGN